MNLKEFEKSREIFEKELKPCPFCGGQGTFLIKSDIEYGDLSIAVLYVKCNSCFANISIRLPAKIARSDNNNFEESFNKIKEKWNKRI